MLVCDIDGTLVGCAPGVQAFNGWRVGQSQLLFGVATGRSFHSALQILEQSGIDWPAFLITSVGAQIHRLDDNGVTYTRERDWQAHIDRGWSRQAILEVLAGVAELVPQSALEQRQHKISYLCEAGLDIAPRLRVLLAEQGLAARVIHSNARCVDILPEAASKGAAVTWLAERYGINREWVYAAGDSGNDREMLQALPCAIIVANHCDGLANAPGLGHAYRACAGHALGVIEGVAHFRAQRHVS
jgi:sucrose-phosphate synthase